MSLWTLIRIVAGLVVLAVVVFTAMLVHHVREEPIGGVFSELVPVSMEAAPVDRLPELDAGVPEIDPGARVFEKARELIAVGDLGGAREKLRTVTNIYPRSKAAPEARRILGEMNLDELLTPDERDGKELYRVRRGDSYLGIAARKETSLDLLMHFNGLTDLRSLQPDQELLVLPLHFRLRVDPRMGTVSLWKEERFLKEYPLRLTIGAAGPGTTKVAGKQAVDGERRFAPASAGYRGAPKVLQLESGGRVIAALPEDHDPAEMARGFYLSAADMEELAMLMRPGNEVEIRPDAR